MQVRPAGREEIEKVLGESHAIWSQGMDLAGYTGFNLAQIDSPWGRERYRFLVGVDEEDAILSALKLYTLPALFEGRVVRVAGIGAVFTPPSRRGRGHATDLIEGALEGARAEGYGLALLFSEIGEAFYARRGFKALPVSEAACRTILPVPWPLEPAWLQGTDPPRAIPGLRPFREDDLDALIGIHDGEDAGRRFRIERDRSAWEQILLKMQLGRCPGGSHDDQFWIVEEAGRPAAYAILEESPGTLRWREHGARPEASARLVDLFWCGLAWARRRGLPRLEGWFLPAQVTVRPLYPVARRRRDSPVAMLRPLDPALAIPAFGREEDCLVWELDSF